MLKAVSSAHTKKFGVAKYPLWRKYQLTIFVINNILLQYSSNFFEAIDSGNIIAFIKDINFYHYI